MDNTELVEELTLELEKAETAIQNLIWVLKEHGLYEASGLEGQVSDRQDRHARRRQAGAGMAGKTRAGSQVRWKL